MVGVHPHLAAGFLCDLAGLTAVVEVGVGEVGVVEVGGALKILEVNSGVMMESLGRQHPDLVDAAYSAALDQVFC